MRSPATRRLATELASNVIGELIDRVEDQFSEIERHARDVVDAVTALQQVKHTRSEIAARRRLEACALALRSAVRRKDEVS